MAGWGDEVLVQARGSTLPAELLVSGIAVFVTATKVIQQKATS
jgi:hypothetical protein